jgi:D-3-phosphoglycerate dehydrogenase / 2-oxoglutarate reductase
LTEPALVSGSNRILITDSDLGTPSIELDIFRRSGFELVERQCRTESDVIDAISETRPIGLLVQYAPISSTVVHNAGPVRAIARYGVGLDTIDVDAASAAGIKVISVPDYATDEVADHTVALVLMLVRQLRRWTEATRDGGWPAAAVGEPMPAMRSLTVGLLGFGRIAQAVAARMQAFGSQVLAHDPFVPKAVFKALGVRAAGYDELWSESLVVSLHVPLSTDTQNCVNEAVFSLMRPGSLLVNTARARLVDREGLEQALDAGTIAGFAVDGWWDEPPKATDRLLRNHRVFVTPHVAYLSSASLERLRRTAAESLVQRLHHSS